MKKVPRIGVGVIVTKDDKVLIGRRVGSHASGTWSFPGGHLEFGETVIECAQREVMEEAGIEITDLHEGPWSEEFFDKEQKQYVTIIMFAVHKDGNVEVREPDSMAEWKWIPWEEVPSQNLAIFTKNAVDKINSTNHK